MFALQFVGVFVALFLLDFVWAKYTYALTQGYAFLASSYAGALIVLSGAAAIGYTHDPLLLAPAMLGAFCGTLVAVKREGK